MRRWAPCLGHVHLHNNGGGWDTHSELAEGTIPMEHILDLLGRLAPQATWTLETTKAGPSCKWLEERGLIGR